MKKNLYLNLGCGERFHPEWTNIDLVSNNPCVQVWDLRSGLPYAENRFEVVYHSHLLEHLPKQRAMPFVRECFRVLKPGGIIRVVVPDLEQIIRIYLQVLEKLSEGVVGWQDRYEWIILELCDQMVREYPGGEMLEYLKQDPLPAQGFVFERMGGEAQRMIRSIRKKLSQENNAQGSLLSTLSTWLLRRVLGKDNYSALQIGRFRRNGEVHQWMYDRYSLGKLLMEAGFQSITQRTAHTSAIDNWVQFNLDTESDSSIYKPDSLYMEAVKLTS